VCQAQREGVQAASFAQQAAAIAAAGLLALSG
jgi:hypothetical protein